MASLINKVLFPMDLKRYMFLSFVALWTMVLLIALITTIIHQTKYQQSPDKVNLEWELKELKADLDTKDQKILKLEDRIKKITWWWYYP